MDDWSFGIAWNMETSFFNLVLFSHTCLNVIIGKFHIVEEKILNYNAKYKPDRSNLSLFYLRQAALTCSTLLWCKWGGGPERLLSCLFLCCIDSWHFLVGIRYKDAVYKCHSSNWLYLHLQPHNCAKCIIHVFYLSLNTKLHLLSSNSTVCTVNTGTVYNVQCTMYNVHCAMCTLWVQFVQCLQYLLC